MTTDYGFTIKCIKQGVHSTEGELAGVMYAMALCHKGHIVEYYFETDSIGRRHVHGYMTARKGLMLSRFRKQFWHIHIDPLKGDVDKTAWLSYIKKDEIGFKEWLSELRQGDYKFQDIIET